MSSSLHRLFSLPLVAALASLGCSAPPDPAIMGALTTGRVTSDGGESAGVAVRAYGVAPDGTLTPASDTGTTSAEGRYSLRITLDEMATRLVVRVQDGSERMTSLGRASIGDVDSVSTHVVLPPIDARSGMATEVDLALETMEDVSLEASAASSLFLSMSASTRLSAIADHSSAVVSAARAVSIARATFVRALDPSIAGAGDLHDALTVIALEEATLATRLDAAASAAEADAAYVMYLDASIAAMFDAGYPREAISAAALSMEAALTTGLGSRMSAGRAEIRQLGAFAVTGAVDEGVGASFESTAIADASATLRATMVTMAGAGATEEAMTAAWASYGMVLETELSARAGLVATLVTTLAADVAVATIALQTTWGLQGLETTPAARVQVYSDYRAAIETTANVDALTLGGVDDAQAHLIILAMGDISAAAE